MSIQTTKFVRKPFFVDAVQVTAENIHEVAKWCDGYVLSTFPKGRTGSVDYIQVHVLQPLSVRQTRAFVGDWVLPASVGHKVYTQKAFAQRFNSAFEVTDGDLTMESDRLARAYGFEVGRGQRLAEVIENISDDNPFMNPDWRSAVNSGY